MVKAPAPNWHELIGALVVIDVSSPFVFIGRMVDEQGAYVVLEDVDVHDLRDAHGTREKYVLDCRRHGVRPNRRWAWVSAREIVGISRLEDVLDY